MGNPRKRWTIGAILLALVLAPLPARTQQTAACYVQAYFSPGISKYLVADLALAQKTVDAALYSLTHPDLTRALVEASQRGVRVRVKLDKLQSANPHQGAAILTLSGAGVSVAVSILSRTMHHKFAVIDGWRVWTGSYNWTVSADRRNAENAALLLCPALAQQYQTQWEGLK